MTRETYTAQKLKIEKEILRLQKQAKALQTKQRNPVIASIIRSMREYDITPEEINTAFNKKSAPAQRSNLDASGAPKRPVPAKYRHPESGETWTGRGKAPRWITTAEVQGQKRDDFLI